MRRAEETKLRFNLRRLSDAVRSLFRSRLAVVGVILLVIFSLGALTAPLFFPANPQANRVGTPLVPPEWMSYFPEGYYMSKNIAVVNNPDFGSPSALQEWAYTTTPASQLSTTIFSYAPSPDGRPSLEVASSSSSVVTVRVSKGFLFPYRGPPGQFQVDDRFVALGVTSPITLSLLISRGTERTYTIYAENITGDGLVTPSFPDSSVNLGGGLAVPEVIFSNINNYTYTVQLTFTGPARMFIERMSLLLYGTSYGLLGADSFGYDLFAEDLYGSRISLFVGLLSAFIGIGLGLVVGLLAGYKTGLVDQVLMRFTDVMLTLPALPLLLVLVGVLGPSLLNIIVIIGFLGWMGFARVIRSQVLSLKERPFVEAARAVGAGTRHILTSHIFPNVVSLTYVNLALAVPGAILTEAALSFLGLGDPTVASWGQIVERARDHQALTTWWWVVPPGIGIALVSLSFVLIGYALDELFNPKLRRRR